MYYCGLKIMKDINDAIIVDDNSCLVGEGLQFPNTERGLIVFQQYLSQNDIEHNSIVLAMDFTFIEGYREAYVLYQNFTAAGYDIRFLDPVKRDIHAKILAERCKNYVGPYKDALKVAVVLSDYQNHKDCFLSSSFEFFSNRVNKMGLSRFSKSFMSMVWTIYTLWAKHIRSPKFLGGVLSISLVVTVFNAIKRKNISNQPYCCIDTKGIKLLDEDFMNYQATLDWKDVCKISCDTEYAREQKESHTVNIYKWNDSRFIQHKEIQCNFLAFYNLLNFYWINFSGRF